MNFASGFEDETGIHENYDPDGDKESGYLSIAWWRKYAEFLEGKLESAQKNAETEPSTSTNKAHEAITLLKECATINGQFHRQEWFIKNKSRINAVVA